jgi:hypothetical protein
MQIFNSLHCIIQRDFSDFDMVFKPGKLTIKKGYGVYYIVFFEGSLAIINGNCKPGVLWNIFGKKTRATNEFDRLDQMVSRVLKSEGYHVVRMIGSVSIGSE